METEIHASRHKLKDLLIKYGGLIPRSDLLYADW